MKRPEGFEPRPDPLGTSDTGRGSSRGGTTRSRASVSGWWVKRVPGTAGRSPSKITATVSPRDSPASDAGQLKSQEVLARRTLRGKIRDRRRFERSEVRRFTRRSRHRRAAFITASGIVLVMGAILAVAVYSPLLALKRINIVGAVRLDSAKIHDAVDGQLQTPLALLNYERLTRELGAFPLIRSYVTEIVPPDILTIRIVERQPIGAIATASGFDIVDPAGVVIEKSGARPPKVPLIDIGGKPPTSPAFRAAVEVLLALPPSVASQLDTVIASSTDNVNLTLAGGGAKILWGSADRSSYKARVLSAVLSKNYPNVTEYNVSAPGQLTYR